VTNSAFVPISKIGGNPWLPMGTPIPQCPYCENTMTFFVQVVKAETVYSLFSCTKCSSDEDVFPEMPAGAKDRETVPVSHAHKSGSWSLLLSDLSRVVERGDYQRIIIEVPLRSDKRALFAGSAMYALVNGDPPWMLRAPKPKGIRLDGRQVDTLDFGFYLFPDYQYSTLTGSPRQIGYSVIARSEASYPNDYYDLFLGGAVYVYRSRDAGIPYIFSVKD